MASGELENVAVAFWSGFWTPRRFDDVLPGLTLAGRQFEFKLMQLTIEIPDELARQLEPERERMVEIIARGLQHTWSGGSRLRREVIFFLARRPAADEIVTFRPSEQATERARDLLGRNEQGELTAEEQAELDEMCEVDRFVSLIKAEVLAQGLTAASLGQPLRC